MNYNTLLSQIKNKGLTVSRLADLIEMSKTGLYAAIEKKTLTVDKLEKISEVLKVPITLFFEGQPGITIDNQETENLKKRISELDEQLENYKLLIEVLKERRAISPYNAWFYGLTPEEQKKEREKMYSGDVLGDFLESVKSIGKDKKDFQPAPENYEETISYLKSIIKKMKDEEKQQLFKK
jgi:transcriptional regulator with XRE-family HTH domain